MICKCKFVVGVANSTKVGLETWLWVQTDLAQSNHFIGLDVCARVSQKIWLQRRQKQKSLLAPVVDLRIVGRTFPFSPLICINKNSMTKLSSAHSHFVIPRNKTCVVLASKVSEKRCARKTLTCFLYSLNDILKWTKNTNKIKKNRLMKKK